MTPIEKTILESLRWLLVNTKPIQTMQEDENLRIYENISKLLSKEKSEEPCCEMPERLNGKHEYIDYEDFVKSKDDAFSEDKD